MIRSVRLVLTWWYVATLALILCGFGTGLYIIVERSLARAIDRSLASQADAVPEAVESFWRAERAAPGAAPGNWADAPADTLKDNITLGRFPAIVSRWAEKTGQLDTEHPVRLLDNEGRALGASPSVAPLGVPMTPDTITASQQGAPIYETYMFGGHRNRVITRAVPDDKGRSLYLVQVGASLEHADASLWRLRRWLLLLIPSALLVTTAVGWFLASKALVPVGRMIAQVQGITAKRLHDRIDVPRSHDELEQLAVTFNDLLARIERSFQRVRQFSAAASHELRTPLTVMKGELELVLRKPRAAEEYQRVLQTQLTAVNRLVKTVSELLTVAKTEMSEDALELGFVELGELAKRARDDFRSLSADRQVRVDVHAPGPVWVCGERLLLERLMSNLLDNALKHTPASGRVTVTITNKERQACLAVQDTGPGIAPEELPTIFDRFFSRWSAADGVPNASTGLGLGLCRWIAEAHQGRIEAASVPGQPGALFSVYLPVSSPPA